MNTKRSILFWLSVTAIALLSIYTKNFTISSSLPRFTTTSIKKVIEKSGNEFLSFIRKIFNYLRTGHWVTCDASKWKSPLIAKYGVTLVLTVDQKGCGKFTTFQKAVDAVPDNAAKPTLIIVDSGTYREKIEIKKTKSNLIVQGQGYQKTFLTWNDTAASSNGTIYSYSVGVFAPKFFAYSISFKNTNPAPPTGVAGKQAVALRIGGDQSAFVDCGFYGYQDTLHADVGRHYFKNCFIEGSVDYIFGNGRSLFENCTLNTVASGPGINGAVAAQQRASLAEKTGFSFVNCKIQGKGLVWLGRAWGVYSTTVFIKTSMTEIVAPEGWNNWKDPSREQKVFFGEHACTGPGANSKSRVKYGKQLSLAEATPYMDISYIDGKQWVPHDIDDI
ncbi:putative pectinesterase 14 [Tanacetum coccineum]|uniref:Pectinesterase n=1 Tax=Tanacetum coccineum TaxID=301880 RepID=A0ABQ5IKH2_9ASTR